MVSVDTHVALVDQRTAPLTGRLDGMNGRLEGLDGRISENAEQIKALGDSLTTVGKQLDGVHEATERLGTLDERLSGELTPLADELRLRPGHADVEEVVAKVVSAAQAEMTARLDSLEETVLTLAEALLRPARQIPDQRREGERS
jgi:archaellum component FlaC